MDTTVKIVLTTAPAGELAQCIANTLVSEGLAACVNIVPNLKSIYRWDGQLQSEEEQLLIIKTVAEKLEALKQRIQRLHSYECPEFLVIDIESGSPQYLEWVKKSCSNQRR